MKDLFNKAKDKAGDLASAAAVKVSAVAKDMRPEAGDLKRAADFVVDTATKAATEINQLGKEALKTDLAKDAAAGAAIGAAVAVPVPVIGPVAGAVIGAGLGVYKNLRQGAQTIETTSPAPSHQGKQALEPTVSTTADKFDELNKLHELKTKGVLTEEEFTAEKKRILDR